MNLSNLFEIQEKLDQRINQEHGLQGQDLLDKKILALQVELGELANEWRGFKFWSKDQKPRVSLACKNCAEIGGWYLSSGFITCDACHGNGEHGNPLLEEYVDCLHFILSIGLEDSGSCVYVGDYQPTKAMSGGVTEQFIALNSCIIDFWYEETTLEPAIRFLLGLGETLGFTWNQIEQAYLDKNKINHERQDTGY